MIYPEHLYYIKKHEKSKHFNIINYYHTKFIKLFSNGLPKYFDATDKKNDKKNIVKKEDGILKNFIFYNSQVVKFLIVDIDSKKNFKSKFEIYEFLSDYNIIPTWILDTKKGFHVGFILKNAIPYKNTKAIEYAKDVLKKLNKFLGGDINAVRLKGRFRNPLLHDTFYTLNTYDLIDINDNIPAYILNEIIINHNENKIVHHDIKKLKELILKTLNNINYIKNVEVGFRNSFIWYMGMMIAKNFQDLPLPIKLKEFEKVEEQIHFYNNNLKNPLKTKEINIIINSYLKGKIMVGLGDYKMWTNEMKKLYINRYRKEKGIIKHSREEQKEINKNKVLQAIYKLKKEGKKIKKTEIQKISKLSKRTVDKYVKELKSDPKFSILFEK